MDSLSFYTKASNLRVGLLSNSTLTSPNTTLPGNVSVAGSLTAPAIIGTNLAIAGTATAAAIQFSGTTAGTYLLFNNNVSTISGTVTTTAYGAFGISPGTALDRYALNAHRWWTGSSGTSSGTVGMQLSSAGLFLTSGGSFAGTLITQSLASIGTINSNGIVDNALVRQPNTYYLDLISNGNNVTASSSGGLFPSTVWAVNVSRPTSFTYVVSNGYVTIPVSGIWMFGYGIYLTSTGNNQQIALRYSDSAGNNYAKTTYPFVATGDFHSINHRYSGLFTAGTQIGVVYDGVFNLSTIMFYEFNLVLVTPL